MPCIRTEHNPSLADKIAFKAKVGKGPTSLETDRMGTNKSNLKFIEPYTLFNERMVIQNF